MVYFSESADSASKISCFSRWHGLHKFFQDVSTRISFRHLRHHRHHVVVLKFCLMSAEFEEM